MRESLERMAVDLEEVARSISAMLDTRMRALDRLSEWNYGLLPTATCIEAQDIHDPNGEGHEQPSHKRDHEVDRVRRASAGGGRLRDLRLGMGAGYYDRLLQRRQHGRWQRPLLIGTAFDIQRVGRLPCQPWDVTLDYVITEKRSYRPSQKQLR